MAQTRAHLSLLALARCRTSSRIVHRARTRAEASERSTEPLLIFFSRASSAAARTPVRLDSVASWLNRSPLVSVPRHDSLYFL